MGLSAWKEYGPDRWRCAAIRRVAICTRPKPMWFPGIFPAWRMAFITILVGTMCSSKGAGAPTLRQLVRKSIRAYGSACLRCIGGGLEVWRTRFPLLSAGHRPCARCLALRRGYPRMEGQGGRNLGCVELTTLMGLDRAEEFSGVEHEDCDLLIAIDPHPENDQSCEDGRAPGAWEAAASQWPGMPICSIHDRSTIGR